MAEGQEKAIPLAYAVSNEGKKVTLAGAFSLFLTGTTLDILGIKQLAISKNPAVGYVPKQKVQKDVQFRGAISDLYRIRSEIASIAYDPVAFRSNPQDTFGDGNNFEIAVTAAAAEAWAAADAAADAAAKESPAASGKKGKHAPPPKRPISGTPRPRASLGSEAEVTAMHVRDQQPGLVVEAQRERRHYGAPAAYTEDTPGMLLDVLPRISNRLLDSRGGGASDGNTPAPDIQMMQQDMGMQTMGGLPQDIGCQATSLPTRNNYSQYEVRRVPDAECDAMLASPGFANFLAAAEPRMEAALLENEVVDVMADELEGLGEEGGEGGGRRERAITEVQSCSELQYSKGRVISAVQWLPGRKGMVAVACTEAAGFSERVEHMGHAHSSAVLVWSMRDPLRPQLVLHSPGEVFALQANPCRPNLLAGGTFDGQVVLWDMAQALDGATQTPRLGRKERAGAKGALGEEEVVGLHPQQLSLVDTSHRACITDLHWLPGLGINREGRPPSRPASAPDARGDKDCWLFATAAADGRVLFWDMRMTPLRFKARNQEKEEAEWRPLFVLPLTSPNSGDLTCAKLSFCFQPDGSPLPVFYVGSTEGELVLADWGKEAGGQSGEETEQGTRCVRAHSAAMTVLQRSPFRSDLILTMGAWTFAVWVDGALKAPLCQSPAAPAMYSAGCWSPARPGVLFAGREDGVLEVWDLLERSHEPILTAQPSAAGIACLAFSPASPAASETSGRPMQQLLAIGDAVGVLHLMDLPRNLRRRHAQEIKSLNALVEREMERLDMLARMAPLRREMAKERAEAADTAKVEVPPAELEAAQKPGPKAVQDASEESYRKLEAEFRAQLGIGPSSAGASPVVARG